MAHREKTKSLTSSQPRADRPRRFRGDRGAALVETAIVLPMLLLVMFGIVEFGLLLGVKLDVSQGAREASRLAAVNFQSTSGSSGATQAAEIVAATCARMELADSSSVSIALPTGSNVGDTVQVQISTVSEPVTGVFDQWLAGRTVVSTVESRLEQPATFTAIATQACP